MEARAFSCLHALQKLDPSVEKLAACMGPDGVDLDALAQVHCGKTFQDAVNESNRLKRLGTVKMLLRAVLLAVASWHWSERLAQRFNELECCITHISEQNRDCRRAVFAAFRAAILTGDAKLVRQAAMRACCLYSTLNGFYRPHSTMLPVAVQRMLVLVTPDKNNQLMHDTLNPPQLTIERVSLTLPLFVKVMRVSEPEEAPSIVPDDQY